MNVFLLVSTLLLLLLFTSAGILLYRISRIQSRYTLGYQVSPRFGNSSNVWSPVTYCSRIRWTFRTPKSTMKFSNGRASCTRNLRELYITSSTQTSIRLRKYASRSKHCRLFWLRVTNNRHPKTPERGARRRGKYRRWRNLKRRRLVSENPRCQIILRLRLTVKKSDKMSRLSSRWRNRLIFKITTKLNIGGDCRRENWRFLLWIEMLLV